MMNRFTLSRWWRLMFVVTVVTLLPSASAQSPTGSPAEVFALFEIEPSQWESFVDGEALTDSELETITRLLYVLPRLSDTDLHRWKTPATCGQVLQTPTAFRGQFVQFAGRVSSVEVTRVEAEVAQRFGYDSYYVVSIMAEEEQGGTIPVRLVTRRVPRSWQNDPERSSITGQPVSGIGVFVKQVPHESDQAGLVAVASRIAWYPQTDATEFGLNAGQQLLGSSGLDVTRFEDLVAGTPLEDADRECFYRLLAAAERIDPRDLDAISQSSFDLTRLLKQPEAEAGQGYRLRGTARRVIRIEVPDEDIQERFGIDHYYEIELFLPLDVEVKLVDPDDGDERVYRSFPVTCCVLEIPAEIELGTTVQQTVEFAGFYLKPWSYRSQFMSMPAGESMSTAPLQHEGLTKHRRQIAPLFIAAEVFAVQPPPARFDFITLAVVAGFAAAMGLILIVGWLNRRSDGRFQRLRRGMAP